MLLLIIRDIQTKGFKKISTISANGKTYQLDKNGFLEDTKQWDRDFVPALAPIIKIKSGLRQGHWDVIHFIRDSFNRTGNCPLAYETCKGIGLTVFELENLFPTGYLRGACKIAGITYKEIHSFYKRTDSALRQAIPESERTYHVDVQGFLVDPSEWDEAFAAHKAQDLCIDQGLTEKHWKLICYLRERFEKSGIIPTLYEVCEAQELSIKQLEELFPAGYHRGAVKIAGLKLR